MVPAAAATALPARSPILRGASLGGRLVGRTSGFGPGNGGSSPSPPASAATAARRSVASRSQWQPDLGGRRLGGDELDLRQREDLKCAAAVAGEGFELVESARG